MKAGRDTRKRIRGYEAKTEYRGLSTAAAKCAAFGRDDVVYRRCEEKMAGQGPGWIDLFGALRLGEYVLKMV
jgi:hypothetical protein